ncbi:TonB-dependent receptor [Propionivibrio sp.]|uniref:TonB-dependent receptor n=1 Tax=Propionivibrio sp. TaxID=2212460 RepID=UPI0039E4FFCC
MLCVPLTLGHALAQESVLPEVEVTASAESAGLGLSEPSATGSRTGIRGQELPASVEKLDARALRERGDFAVVDAITRTTGLTSQGTGGNGGMAFSSRGFAGVNSVGVAEDGTRLGVAAGTINYPNDSWGYESIEVLRGPASIVYGAGTAGAVINAVRKQPSRESSSEALLGVGEYGTARLGLGFTGPIGEIASYRVDVYGHYSDGERDLGRSQGGKFMGTLRLQPSSDLRFELLADVSEQKPEDYWGTPIYSGRVVKRLRDENYNVSDGVIRYEDKRLRARAEWAANDWLTLRDEVYYFQSDRHWKNVENYAYNPATGKVTRSSYLEIKHDLDQRGNRLEAAINAGAHKAVLGWEVSSADGRFSNNSPYGGTSVVSADDPVHGVWSSPDVTRAKFDTDTTQHAFYFEDAWRFAEKWQLLFGARRDLSDYSRHELVSGTSFDKDLAGTSWRLGLTHFVTPDLSVYGQYSKGYDPVDSMLTLSLANSSFKLTSAKQAEAGVKQQFGQGLGEWTAAIYRIEKDDIITRDPVTPSISVQGGSQHAKGLELAAVLRPTKNWRFEGNYARTDAEFDELIEAGGADRAGNRPSNVARNVANLWGHYLVGSWQTSLGARYVGKRYANNANTLTLPSYTVLDGAVSWRYNPRATLRLLGRNLTNKVYAAAAYGSSQYLMGDDRRVELIAELKF